jgi:hypothetical protein
MREKYDVREGDWEPSILTALHLQLMQIKAQLENLEGLEIDINFQQKSAINLIDFQLKDSSLTTALKYISQFSGIQISIQPDAVVIGSAEAIAKLED